MSELPEQIFTGVAPPDELQLADDAFIGPSGEFKRLVLPQTEADPASLIVSFHGVLSTQFGDSYMVADGRKHHCPDFEVQVGDSSSSRKGSGSNYAIRLGRLIERDFDQKRLFRGVASGEGLVTSLRDLATYQQERERHFLCILSELGQMFAVMRREGSTLSAFVRQSWDGDPLHINTKEKKILFDSPYALGLLAHITDSELLSKLDDVSYCNGFANRFRFYFVRRSKLLPHGGNPVDFSELAAELKKIIECGRNSGLVVRSKAANELWEERYGELTTHPKGLRGSLCARAPGFQSDVHFHICVLNGSVLVVFIDTL